MPRLMIVLGLLFLVIGFAATNLVGRNAYHRYRLEVELAGPAGHETGKVVQEVRFSAGTASGLDNFTYLNVFGGGQALVMRPASGGELIALMANVDEDTYWNLFLDACGLHHGEKESPGSFVARIAAFRGSCDVPAQRQPRFAYLTNPTDPRTARLVSPNEFVSVTGSELVAVRIVTTDDAVSDDIDTRLPWLAQQDGRDVLHGLKIGRETLHTSAFKAIGPTITWGH